MKTAWESKGELVNAVHEHESYIMLRLAYDAFNAWFKTMSAPPPQPPVIAKPTKGFRYGTRNIILDLCVVMQFYIFFPPIYL